MIAGWQCATDPIAAAIATCLASGSAADFAIDHTRGRQHNHKHRLLITLNPNPPLASAHLALATVTDCLAVMNITTNMDVDDPWMFSASRAEPEALALARAGGVGGQTYLYTNEALGPAQGSYSTYGAGGRRWV